MSVHGRGALRASSHRSRPVQLAVLTFAAALAIGSLVVNPTPAAAAGMKVVVVVGPVESNTSNYVTNAKRYAAQARSYGATVVEIYSPDATWSKVRAAANGANVLIYLGHGNGYPSAYGVFSAYTKDGMGLNSSAGRGNSNTRYFGEYYIRHDIHLAADAVVILNRLCYASGDSEWGRANPTKSVAMRRADNYGAGFLRANAKAVFAIGIDSASYTLRSLLSSTKTIGQIFKSDPARDLRYDFSFASVRTPGYRVWMDPYAPGRYYRSVVGELELSAVTVRGG